MKAAIALKYLESKTPVDLVEKITGMYKGTYGYSFVDQDGLNIESCTGHPDPKGLIESQDAVKAKTLYFFGETAPALDEDLQPWEMLRNSKNEIVCVGFLEGDFGQTKPDSSHISAYHTQQNLARKLRLALKSLKDNTEELYQHCKSDDFQEEIKELFVGDGSIVLHFANDEILWYCNPIDRKKTTAFGMFSDMCGWEAPKTMPDGVHAVPDKKIDLSKLPGAKGSKVAPQEKERTSEAPKAVLAPSTNGPTTYLDILKTKPLSFITEDKAENFLKGGSKFKHIENWYMNVDGDGKWPADFNRASIKELWDDLVETYRNRGDWKACVKKLPGVLSKKARNEAKKEYEELVKAGTATDVGDKVTLTNTVEATREDVTKKVTPVEGVSADGEYLPTISEGSPSQTTGIERQIL